MVLLYLLFESPHKHPRGAGNFLIDKLELSDEQKQNFIALDKHHRSIMMGYDEAIIDYKKELFISVSKKESIDTLITTKIGVFEGKKEEEIFRFLLEVRKICNQSQVEKLDMLLRKIPFSRRPPNGPPYHPPHFDD